MRSETGRNPPPLQYLPEGSHAARAAQPTSTPMLRAVPAMLRAAASMSVAFMSLIFSFAIARTSSQVSLPTLVLLGSFEPAPGFFEVGRPQAFFTSTLAGGLFITNVYERSAYTV